METQHPHLSLTDLGIRPAVTTTVEATLDQVARQLSENEVRAVVVVDEEQRPIGVVTHRDLVRRALAHRMPLETPIREIMSREVITIRDDADASDAARQMANRECRHLPVVNDDGRVIGVATFDDIFTAIRDSLDALSLVIRHERHPSMARMS